MLFAENTHEINICAWIHLQCYFPGWDPLLPSLIHFIPLSERISPLFYLLGDPSFGDLGANVHPLSSLVSDQLFTPCFLTLPNPSRQHPWFMLHVYRDDITTLATLSDTTTYSRTLCCGSRRLWHRSGSCFSLWYRSDWLFTLKRIRIESLLFQTDNIHKRVLYSSSLIFLVRRSPRSQPAGIHC